MLSLCGTSVSNRSYVGSIVNRTTGMVGLATAESQRMDAAIAIALLSRSERRLTFRLLRRQHFAIKRLQPVGVFLLAQSL